MDTLELRVHLRPFEILMRRHKAHLDVLMEYQSIKDELLDFKQQVTWACTRLEANGAEASLDPFEQILEDILDQCDLLADRIDDFEKQGQATPSLEEIYHQILPVIERYQEQMDQV